MAIAPNTTPDEGESSATIRDRRINLTKQILIDLGYLSKQ
jgi:hypothetical protein